MKNMSIYLHTPKEAMEFVDEMSKLPYAADLSYGNCMVDAKSILGILGMAVCKNATLTIYGTEDMDDVEKMLEKYAA